MPRKRRFAKRRPPLSVSTALRHYLTFGDIAAATALQTPDSSEYEWELFDGIGAHSHQAAWHVIEDEALVAWTAAYPGTRPESWWLWSAPDLRQVWGRFTPCPGRGRCQPTGIPYGRPDDWDDVPMVESQAGHLERHALWLPGERTRLALEAFDPRPFSWDLTVSPGGSSLFVGRR